MIILSEKRAAKYFVSHESGALEKKWTSTTHEYESTIFKLNENRPTQSIHTCKEKRSTNHRWNPFNTSLCTLMDLIWHRYIHLFVVFNLFYLWVSKRIKALEKFIFGPMWEHFTPFPIPIWDAAWFKWWKICTFGRRV